MVLSQFEKDKITFNELIRIYKSYEDKFEKHIAELKVLYEQALTKKQNQFARDIGEEIDDYNLDYNQEVKSMIEQAKYNNPPISYDYRIRLIRKAIDNARYTINEMPQFIEESKEKLDRRSRVHKKSKPLSKIKKPIHKKKCRC